MLFRYRDPDENPWAKAATIATVLATVVAALTFFCVMIGYPPEAEEDAPKIVIIDPDDWKVVPLEDLDPPNRTELVPDPDGPKGDPLRQYLDTDTDTRGGGTSSPPRTTRRAKTRQAPEPTPPPPPTPVIREPRLLTTLDQRRISRRYPPDALSSGVEGFVKLRCRVALDTTLACRVEEETPRGHGFGRAALRIAQDLRALRVWRMALPSPAARSCATFAL